METPNKISITRALTEIKNLDDQIKKAIAQGRFCYATKGKEDRMTVPGTTSTPQALKEKIESTYQKIHDLTTRRAKLKDAIQKSNSVTEVVVNNVRMTVQQAIETKQSIDYKRMLFEQMRQNYTMCVSEVERQNRTLDTQIENAVQQAYNNDKGKVTQEQYDAVATPRRKDHEYAILDPLNIQSLLETMAEEINGFVMEVDFVLAESNARTEIEI